MERLTYILQQWLTVISLSVSYRSKNIAVALFSLLCVHICSATVIKGKYYFRPEDATFDSIAHLVLTSEVNRANDSRVTEWIGKMKDIASRSRNPVLDARSTLWQIRTTQLNANPDSCIEVLEKARGRIPKNYDYDYACLSYQLAGNHDRIGNYFNTYQLLQEAIPIFEKYGDDYFLGNARLLLGLMYSSIGDYDQALEEINLAEHHYSAYGYPNNRIAYFKATLAKDENEKVHLYKEAIEQGGDDPGMSIQAYEQLATIYNARNESDSAMYYLRLGENMRAEMVPDNLLLKIILNIQKAEVLYSREEYDKALALLKETEIIALHYPNEYWEPSIYKYMARIYENKGNNQQAFSYLKKYLKAYERQTNAFRGQEIPKAKAREAIQRQKELITNMEQETK
ncbi:MAG: tetratricopeptide repeat protein, partial [Muribaculaceae bacterium]|nr:tetratricopeptide repeat protein [Muribaculaceae bacterium]